MRIDTPDTVFGDFWHDNGAWVFALCQVCSKQRIHIDMIAVFELREIFAVFCDKIEPEECLVLLPAVFIDAVGGIEVLRRTGKLVSLYHCDTFFESEMPL